MIVHFTVFDRNGLAVRGGTVANYSDIDVQAVRFGELSLLGKWETGRAKLVNWEIVSVEMTVRPITKEQVRAWANRLLKYTDWQVIKAFETGGKVPARTKKERQSIRNGCNKLEKMGKIPQDFRDEKHWK